MTAPPPDGPWLRRYQPRGHPRLRLVCFLHAGGSATFYRTWARNAAPGLEVVAVQYPGRAERIAEDHAGSVGEVAAAVVAALLDDLDAPAAPTALFGHSLGAAIAFEVALGWERRCGNPLTHLFVSGRPEPTWPGDKHLGTDDQVWEDVRRLGGTLPDIADNAELRALALPSVRADYRVSETYVSDSTQRVSCPITAYTGQDDTEIEPGLVVGWAGRTTGEFTWSVFPGDHFYLVPHRSALTADLVSRLGPAVTDSLWPSTP